MLQPPRGAPDLQSHVPRSDGIEHTVDSLFEAVAHGLMSLWTFIRKAMWWSDSGAPHSIEWLSDNGPCYTARATCEFARAVGLLVCTTPIYSPQSNGMAEAFVKTFKRDYVYVNRLPSAIEVIAQLP